MSIKHFPFVLLVFLSSLFLCGCWAPESFDVRVTIERDGSYQFVYDGTVVYLPAAAERRLTAADESKLRTMADELREDVSFKRVVYQGKGRYRVLYEKHIRAGEPFYFWGEEMKWFAVLPEAGRSISVRGFGLKPGDVAELSSIGVKIKGSLAVSVPFRAEVLQHNAHSEPMVSGLFGAYRWEINSMAAEPMIVFRLP